jgi:hypothetical protein
MKNTRSPLKAKTPRHRGFATQKQQYVDAIVADMHPHFNYEGEA